MDSSKLVYTTLHARIYARIAIAINSALTIIALVLLFAGGEVIVYWDSFSQRFRDEVLRQFNYSNPLVMSDVRAFDEVDRPGHSLFRNESTHLIIEYGTTWWGCWCWNDPPLKEGLPSIQRLLEFHSVSQLLLRFTFLTSLSLRPIVTYARSLAVMDRLSNMPSKGTVSPLPRVPRPPSLFVSALLFASPALQFLSTLAGSFALLWQQDLDFHDLMYVSYYAFALFYLLHMIVYTGIELLEPERTIASRVGTRAAIIITYCWTMSRTLQRQVDFLNRKTCDVNVAPLDALCEYLLLLTITLFSLLEWTDVWGLRVVVVRNPEEFAMINRKLNVAIEDDDEDERL